MICSWLNMSLGTAPGLGPRAEEFNDTFVGKKKWLTPCSWLKQLRSVRTPHDLGLYDLADQVFVIADVWEKASATPEASRRYLVDGWLGKVLYLELSQPCGREYSRGELESTSKPDHRPMTI